MRTNLFRFAVCTIVVAMGLGGAGERVSGDDAGLKERLIKRLGRIDRVVERGIEAGEMAGCVVVVGRREGVLWRHGYGQSEVLPEGEPMMVDTVFDLASLTKPLATGAAVMLLVDQGKIRLDEPAATYWPEFGTLGKEKITVRDLLSHRGGLIPDNALTDYQKGRASSYEKICSLQPTALPGEKFIYSDVGFIVLGKVVENVSGERLDDFTKRHLYEPLGMKETMYNPPEQLRQRAAATEKRGDRWMKGEVHDPRAWEMEGVAGHAGLFSTADDLSRFARMILNRGTLEDVRLLQESTVEEILSPQQAAKAIRGLGWDKDSPYSSNRGDLLSDGSIGHGGFTGTSLWIDPEQDLYVIFLSNRLHPDGKGSVNGIAGRIANIAAASIVPDRASGE